MDKQIVFKTSAFGGFEKKAVLDYIYKLNEDTGHTQSALREQLGAATGEAQSLSGELHRANERIKTLQQNLDNSNAELVGERTRIVELGNLNEGLREELERDRERLSQREQELELLIAENRSLKAQNDDFIAKQEEINQSVARIGQLMLVARADADAMLESAETEGRQICLQAEQEAEDLRHDAQDRAQSMLDDAERRSREMLSDAEMRSVAMLRSSEARSADMINKARYSIEDASDRLTGLKTDMRQVTSLLGHLFTQLKEKAGEVDSSIEGAFTLLSGAGSEPAPQEPAAAAPVEEASETPEVEAEPVEQDDHTEPEDATDSFFRSAAEV